MCWGNLCAISLEEQWPLLSAAPQPRTRQAPPRWPGTPVYVGLSQRCMVSPGVSDCAHRELFKVSEHKWALQSMRKRGWDPPPCQEEEGGLSSPKETGCREGLEPRSSSQHTPRPLQGQSGGYCLGIKPAMNNSAGQHSSLIQGVDKRHVVSSNHRLEGCEKRTC